MTEFNPMEKRVLDKLLGAENDSLALLRQQLAAAAVAGRQMTGVGFYTDIKLPAEAPRLAGSPSFKIGDVIGSAENIAHGIGFLLYVKDGAIEMLEGYTYDEPWPQELRNLELRYAGGQSRYFSFLGQARG